MKNILRASALLLALTVAGAACASDDPDDAGTTEAGDDTGTTEAGDDTGTTEAGDDTGTTEAMDDGETDPAAEAETVVNIALDSPDHTILVEALTKAELVETLQGEGPFTVFAPTDDAFKAYITEKGISKDELLEDAGLADILQGHVVADTIPSSAITEAGAELTTLTGTVEAKLDGTKALVGGAEVSAPDLAAGNGVVHVIDSVIVAE